MALRQMSNFIDEKNRNKKYINKANFVLVSIIFIGLITITEGNFQDVHHSCNHVHPKADEVGNFDLF
jgi:hypothetical protein